VSILHPVLTNAQRESTRSKKTTASKYALARIRAQRERERIDELLGENLKEERETLFEQSLSLIGNVNSERVAKAIEAIQEFETAYDGTNSFRKPRVLVSFIERS